MVSLVSRKDVLAAIAGGKDIVLTAYALRRGSVFRALESAAAHRARITVRLDGHTYKDRNGALLRENSGAVAELRRLGADAQLVHLSDDDGPSLHMKAVVVDRTAFLNDRNWPDSGEDTILRDDAAPDVSAVLDAALNRHGTAGPALATDKADAVRAEGKMLCAAARDVEVESEAFGVSGQTYAALRKLAASGVHCRLLVSRSNAASSSRMRHALDLLASQGVEIRAGAFEEKLAVADGHRAWAGSANATAAEEDGDQIDWGLVTDDATVIAGLDAQFAHNWAHSRPLNFTAKQETRT